MTTRDQTPTPPGYDFHVDRHVEGHAIVVRVAGEVDMLTAPAVHEQLRAAEALVTPPFPVVLDLTGVDYIGSAGLALLVEHRDRCDRLGARFRVVAASRAVLRPVDLLGLDRVVDIVDDMTSALDRIPVARVSPERGPSPLPSGRQRVHSPVGAQRHQPVAGDGE